MTTHLSFCVFEFLAAGRQGRLLPSRWPLSSFGMIKFAFWMLAIDPF